MCRATAPRARRLAWQPINLVKRYGERAAYVIPPQSTGRSDDDAEPSPMNTCLTASTRLAQPARSRPLSLSVGLRPEDVRRSSYRPPLAGAVVPTAVPDAAPRHVGRVPLNVVSLRFLDPDLERRYQREAGAESLAGFQIITAAAAMGWLFATLVVPSGTPIAIAVALPVCSAMALLNFAVFLFSDRADTLDRQHMVASFLTAVNGLVILLFASSGGVLPGYGVSALMLLFTFGFVSRTSFVFAAWRSGAVGVGFVAAAVSYSGPGSLLVDTFVFGAAVIGSLVALRLLEQSRRRVFYQDGIITEQADALRVEKEKSDGLLLNVLPAPISARLLTGERTIADEYPSVTVLFADIVGFTPLAARLRPAEVIELLSGLFARFDELVAERGIEKIKTMGDSYMAAGGLPGPLADHAAQVVDLGLAMIDVATRATHRAADVRLRVGVHSGPVVGGVIGDRKFAFDIWGDTVNIASRLESQGVPNRVHVSAATWQLVKGRFVGVPRGRIDLRGSGAMETYTIDRLSSATLAS
jgi:class 3 adenylate cyclase